MKPTIGRVVHYCLSAKDAEQVNRRRTSGKSIAERITSGSWPIGAMAHIGNRAVEGQLYPAEIVMAMADSPDPGAKVVYVNLKVSLDGTDFFWAEKVYEGHGRGEWRWPQLEPNSKSLRPSPGLFPSSAVQQPRIESEGVSSPMPRYQCHKKVSALQVERIIVNPNPDGLTFPVTLHFAEKGFAPMKLHRDFCDKHPLTEGCYYVVYDDGYCSISPKKAFEEGYIRLDADDRIQL